MIWVWYDCGKSMIRVWQECWVDLPHRQEGWTPYDKSMVIDKSMVKNRLEYDKCMIRVWYEYDKSMISVMIRVW